MLSSSSPARLASSPVSATIGQTPPSSPTLSSDSPIFKSTSVSHAPIASDEAVNAFSLLGKRKKPLMELDCNARSVKRRALQMEVKKGTKLATAKEQMQLSLGQKIETRCRDCGMLFVASSKEDQKMHKKFHNQMYDGVGIGPVLGERLAQHNLLPDGHVDDGTDKEVICSITGSSPRWQRTHARKVLDIVTSSLGAVEISDEALSERLPDSLNLQHRYETWLYLRGSTCVATMLVQYNIHSARRVIASTRHEMETLSTGSTLDKLRRRREEAVIDEQAPIQVSQKLESASLGISRIWTAPACRGAGHAVQLLNALLRHHNKQVTPDTTVEAATHHKNNVKDRTRQAEAFKEVKTPKINLIAFSQPTSSGARLARKFFGRPYGWLVYNE